MSLSEEAMTSLEGHIPELAESAVTQAYWQALASGAFPACACSQCPNGSGKSTIQSVIRPELLGVYINPDELGKDIARFDFLRRKLVHLPLLCRDRGSAHQPLAGAEPGESGWTSGARR